MRGDKPKPRVLIRSQILFEPPALPGPELVLRGRTRGDVPKIAVDHGEVAVAPVERIVRIADVEELVELPAIPFVIAESREERGLTQHLALDLEEDGPLRRVCAVGDQVARVQHEVWSSVLHDARDDAAMQFVAR